ncbi:MAG: TatD family hydrolase [Magnetococcales bacterium]|nr:TatD family hydrolase [Magnetococcales bacterium]
MIDTHCHLDLPVFDQDRQQVLERSQQAGVDQLVVPGLHLNRFQRLVALSGPTIHIALGLHPLFYSDHPKASLSQLKEWLKTSNPIALGEIGLDFRHANAKQPQQIDLFCAQLALAKAFHLPVLLHVVKAHDQTLAILRRFNHPFGGIVHSFNGSLQQAQHYLDRGFLLGFGGVVTRQKAKKIRRVAASLPDSALVLETDSPDLPPAGREGLRNEPANLPLVVNTLAHLRGVSENHIIQTTRQNTQQLLGLNR